jgi:hypothetical protein
MGEVSYPKVALTRHLPGKATQLDPWGKPIFVFGRVEQVSRNWIQIKTNSKEIGQAADYGHVLLIGETYIYWCPRCKTSVWEMERQKSRGACPHCMQGLWALQLGDRVRLHYRVGVERGTGGMIVSGGGAWWGEKII